MENPKRNFRKLIAQNDLDTLFPSLVEYTEKAGLDELYNKALLQQARFRQLSDDQNAGILDYDDLTRNRITLTQSLLNLIDQLPDPILPGAAPAKPTKARGIKEYLLKRQIFFALLIVYPHALAGRYFPPDGVFDFDRDHRAFVCLLSRSDF